MQNMIWMIIDDIIDVIGINFDIDIDINDIIVNKCWLQYLPFFRIEF